MNNNKGFTLIEIISVIAILLAITLVSIPSINAIIENNKEKNWTSIVHSIETSSENFIEYYRDDIPFNDDNTYYFKLNVLASLKLIKFPIYDPWTNDEISGDTCVKVTKNSDGSLSYKYPNECSGNATTTNTKPILELKTNKTLVKKGSSVNLKDYVKDYSSATTPKRYLKLNIVDKNNNYVTTLDTTLISSKEIIDYNVIDLLNGESSDIQNIEFIVTETNPKINVVFLTDSTTSKNLQTKNLGDWSNNLETRLNENIIGGLKYEVGVKTENSTLIKDIDVVESSSGSVNIIISECSGDTAASFKGVYKDSYLVFSGGQTNWCYATGGSTGGGENSGGAFSIMDLKTNESVLAIQDMNNCKYHTSGNIYCRGTTTTSAWGMALQMTGSTTITYREYSFNDTNNKYELLNHADYVSGDYDSTAYKYCYEGYSYNNSTAMRKQKACRGSYIWSGSYTAGNSIIFDTNKVKYDQMVSLFNESSDEWHTHTNPDGQLYFENFELRDYFNIDELSDRVVLVKDPKETVVKIDDDTYGHLVFYEYHIGSVGPRIYPYVLYDTKKNAENFTIDLSKHNSTSPNKTYYVVLAKKPSNHTQNIEVSSTGNSNTKTIIYGDSTSQTNFGSKLSGITKKSYTNIDTVLNDLSNIIINN